VVIKAVVIWILGLVTLVPYVTWFVLFRASPDQYAILITLVLFWIFGFWGVAGPLIALVKVRTVFRALERVQTKDDLLATLRSADARDVAIDLIATENHIPRFLAVRVYNLLLSRLGSLESRPSDERAVS
jgi:hypothetical protein